MYYYICECTNYTLHYITLHCMYMYTYTTLHTYRHTYIHTYIHPYIHIYIHTSKGSRLWPAGAMDQAALQRVTLVRTSGTLCWTVWGAREQQSLRTWIVSFFLESAVTQMAHSSGEWCLLWISRLTPCFCYVAMHCRYFAETKTLWEHLNSSADIFQLGAFKTTHVLMMSLQLRQACR